MKKILPQLVAGFIILCLVVGRASAADQTHEPAYLPLEKTLSERPWIIR